MMETIKMTVDQWAQVIDSPRQRDTVRHAEKAVRRHLKAASPTHARVSAARLPGGTLVKLDGHTRSLLWMDGRLERPKAVFVDVITVKSMDEAKELYSHFDNDGAVEHAGDRLFGAYGESGIAPTSGLLLACQHTSVFKLLAGINTPIYTAVKQWKRELELLDSLGASKNSMRSGMVMGALCVFRVRGERALPFLIAVLADAGSRNDAGSCGVDAIVRYEKNYKGRSGETQIRDLAERFIAAFEGWIVGRRFPQAVRPRSFSDYLGRVE